MNICELIEGVGGPDKIVGIQFLDQCSTRLDYNHNSGTKITFGTDQPLAPTTGTRDLGIIVWLDRAAVKAAIAAERAKADAS